MKNLQFFIILLTVSMFTLNLVVLGNELVTIDSETTRLLQKLDASDVVISDFSITLDDDYDFNDSVSPYDQEFATDTHELKDISVKLTGQIKGSGNFKELEVHRSEFNYDINDIEELDGKVNLYSSNSNTIFTSLSSDPDYLNRSGNFNAGRDAGFSFEIYNRGTTTSTNILLFIYIDDTYLGYVSLGDLPSGYYFEGGFELSGVGSGTHNIRLNLDNGQSINRNFVWDLTSQSNLPDILCDIYNVTGSYGVKAREDVNYEFKLINIGLGSTSKNILCQFYAGNEYLGSVTLYGGLPVGGSATGSFTLNFSNNIGLYSISMVVDSLNTIEESDKGNNYAYTNTLSIGMHPSHLRFQKTDNFVVFVSSALTTKYPSADFGRAIEWNNITKHVKINNVKYGSNPTNENVRVFLKELEPGERGITRELVNDGKMDYIHIDITSVQNVFQDLKKDVERTYLHELGHTVGLGHPENYGYTTQMSIMHNSIHTYSSHTITYEDKFNLIDLHSFKDLY